MTTSSQPNGMSAMKTKKAKPYLLYSDVHFHDWSAFSSVDEDGVNSRLRVQIAELQRAYDTLKEAGGDTAYCAGDLFHVRGKLKPSVVNPVRNFYRRQHEAGICTAILSGNHDLETNDAAELTSAVTAITNEYTTAVNEVNLAPPVVMVPWQSSMETLRGVLDGLASKLGEERKNLDLIIHAPVNGVLINIPETGFNASELEKYGFRRVFSGHYHNHVRLSETVWSVGATTHQTWSDIGTRAGFMLVWPDEETFFASRAPQFMHLPWGAPEDELVEVDGNYVRADMMDPTPERIKALRNELEKYGAKGVTIRELASTKTTREGGTTVSSLDSLPTSVQKYAAEKYDNDIARLCEKILVEATSA